MCANLVVYFLEVALGGIVCVECREFQPEILAKIDGESDIHRCRFAGAAKSVEVLPSGQFTIEFPWNQNEWSKMRLVRLIALEPLEKAEGSEKRRDASLTNT